MLPQVFIGSSQQGRALAEVLALDLAPEVDAKLWSEGIFELSYTAIEALDRVSRSYDFAVLLATPDDISASRGQKVKYRGTTLSLKWAFSWGRSAVIERSSLSKRVALSTCLLTCLESRLHATA